VSFILGERRQWCQSYPATPDSVPLARRELAQFAQDAGAATEQLERVRLAASEAITNIVLHAYDGSAGEVHIDADVATGELRVQIADDGDALQPRFENTGLGVGLALIAQASDELDIVKRPEGGTELRMRFGLDRASRRT
jgi:stage II sporulation protein AB (anti-sigma F factor)